jgi:hypothetical protein
LRLTTTPPGPSEGAAGGSVTTTSAISSSEAAEASGEIALGLDLEAGLDLEGGLPRRAMDLEALTMRCWKRELKRGWKPDFVDEPVFR